MRRGILTLVLLLIAVAVLAQVKTISGRVLDESGHPVMAVSVLLLNEKGGHVKFAKTDSKGNFSLSIPERTKIAKIAFNSVGYERQVVEIDKYMKGNRRVKLAERVQALREVEVKPQLFRVKGDTIIYSVAGLREKQDRTIEDVIARIPGITVTTDGLILYKNKPISTFYVDGKDVTGDRYAMISKNLSADKVDSVEVLQHHQPINALRGKSFSEAAALNLVLKPDARGQWNGTLDLGIGTALQEPWRWTRKVRSVELFFGKRLQSVNLYKHNNTAEDIASEVKRAASFLPGEGGPLSSLCAVGTGRFGFNNSHMVATNWNWDGNKSGNFRFQMSGLWDKSTAHSYSEQTYLDADGNKLVTQERNAVGYTSDWNAELNYTLNLAKVYVSNCIGGNVNFDHSYAQTILNGKQRTERVLPRKRSVSDNLSLTFSGEESLCSSLTSSFNYAYCPGTLRLYDGTDETLNMKTLTWNTKYSLQVALAEKLDFIMNLMYDMQRKNEYVVYNDTTGSVRYKEGKVTVDPGLSYSPLKRFELSVFCEAAWLSRRLGTDKDNRIYVQPSARLKWELVKSWTFLSMYHHNFSPSGFEMNGLRTYTSYNYASSGIGTNTNTSGDNLNCMLNYWNLNTGWRGGVGYDYNRSKLKTLYESVLTDGVYIRQSVGEENVSSSQSVSANLSKSFSAMRTKVGLSGSYGWSGFYYLYNKQKMHSKAQTCSAGLSWSMRPVKWFNFTENTSFYLSKQDAARGTTLYRSFCHLLNLFFTPGKFVIAMKNECHHSADGSEKFDIYSAASASYKTQKYELSLNMNNMWGFNKREFKSISTLGTSYFVTEMRPREILAAITFSL